MANILYICTASPVLYFGYSQNGEEVFAEMVDGQRHASEINASLGRLMEKINLSEMDAVAISEGPGSYTGLRVAMAFAKALVVSLDIELIVMDTLKIMRWTQDLESNQKVYTAIDARREDVFACIWGDAENKKVPTGAYTLNAENPLSEYYQDELLLLGSGASKSQIYFPKSQIIVFSSEQYMASMKKLSGEKFQNGEFADVISAHPNYGKAPFVTTPKKRF